LTCCQRFIPHALFTNNDGKSLAELLNETIARQLLFIVIAVDDELNAYTVLMDRSS